MQYSDFMAFIRNTFGHLVETFKENEEYGSLNFGSQEIRRVGYTTNLTPEVVQLAKNANVQLIITHHDAWGFMYGMKAECKRMLEENGIAHFYIHYPLDFVEFGTCNSLLYEIGADEIIQQTEYKNGTEFIGIGQMAEPVAFEQLIATASRQLGEEVKAWKNDTNPLIRKIGVITGAGHSTDLMKQAKDAGCDVYITGEKTVYSVQYAKFIGLNHIVGSHTFTEIFGVRSLAHKLKEAFDYLDAIYLEEDHLEQ
ncbi:Nif3-like dinuclear metal center hexameric protein [Paenibacillus sp. MMS18-CY102]|uniref:Nif3-like dinuclear metal center hexameric protein n=1 Tax=Paenibacillus sp. MMS18-CY102 TaxID=2682849 RepID=UPI001366742F|nr:Nif3-like dinuclear metal center hexameric protein [Paenibacillus sp. MMS18-CY102]MWC29301.1 Nif3-like dinuclear metal center hexameric protein [Paenibacillus sp. MMS18-CY102]